MGTITFQFLRDVQKREKSTITLQEVPQTFYSDVAGYLAKKKKNVKEYENIVPIVKFILDRREQKIINSAIRYSRSMNGKKPKNLLKEEEELFERLVEVIKLYRIDIERLKDFKSKGVKEYVVKEDIPEFVAPDMNNYGPWKKGEKIIINDDVAELLLESDKIEMVIK